MPGPFPRFLPTYIPAKPTSPSLKQRNRPPLIPLIPLHHTLNAKSRIPSRVPREILIQLISHRTLHIHRIPLHPRTPSSAKASQSPHPLRRSLPCTYPQHPTQPPNPPPHTPPQVIPPPQNLPPPIQIKAQLLNRIRKESITLSDALFFDRVGGWDGGCEGIV